MLQLEIKFSSVIITWAQTLSSEDKTH